MSTVTDLVWNNGQNVAGLFQDSSDGFTFYRSDHPDPALASKGELSGVANPFTCLWVIIERILAIQVPI